MGLLQTLKPEWWFSAHLHVRFQATVVHDENLPSSTQQPLAPGPSVPNPEEIVIDDDDIEVVEPALAVQSSAPPRNSDEIVLTDEENDVAVPPLPPPPPSKTKFLALDKCLPKRQFLEVSIHLSHPCKPFLSNGFRLLTYQSRKDCLFFSQRKDKVDLGLG